MSDNRRHITEFSRILSYVQRKMSFKDRYDLEKESQSDPFLKDALDGYDNIDGEELAKDLSVIQSRIKLQSKPIRKKLGYLKIAASIALFIGVGVLSYIIIDNSMSPKHVADTVKKEGKVFEVSDSIKEETVLLEKSIVVEDNEEEIVPKKEVDLATTAASKDKADDFILENEKEELVVEEVIARSDVDQNKSVARLEQVEEERVGGLLSETESVEETEEVVEQQSVQSPEVVQEQTYAMIAENAKEDRGFKKSKRKSSVSAESKSLASDMPDDMNVGITVKSNEFVPQGGVVDYGAYVQDNINITLFEEGIVVISFEVDDNGTPVNIKSGMKITERQLNELSRVIKRGVIWELQEGKSNNQGARVEVMLKFSK